jgi:hypothetical protein
MARSTRGSHVDQRPRRNRRTGDTGSATAGPLEDEYLTEKELARLLGVSPRTLQGWRLRGNGPPFCVFSERCIRYLRSDAAEWARSRRRRSTSDSPSKERS